MSRNLLLSEYDAELSTAAALHMADGATIKNHAATWTGRLAGITVHFDLVPDDRPGAMTPRLSLGTTSCLQTDPLVALAQVEEARVTILRATAAYAELRGVSVWLREAPCDSCAGGSGVGRRSCQRCGSTGVRREP